MPIEICAVGSFVLWAALDELSETAFALTTSLPIAAKTFCFPGMEATSPCQNTSGRV